jgi:CheY-like chemotaxis protein
MSKRVLVVDNDAFFVEFLSELLERHGYGVVKAYNGRQALEHLKKDHAFALLFVDMVMPEVDGRQVIQTVRQMPQGGDIPIVAVSGVIIEQLERLEELNADFFVAKGPMAAMEQKIEALLKRMTTTGDGKTPAWPAKQKPNKGGAETIYPEIDQYTRLKLAFEKVGIAILIVDKSGHITDINPEALRLFDRIPPKIINQPMLDLFDESCRKALVEVCKHLARKPNIPHLSLAAHFDGRPLRAMVSLLRHQKAMIGWVVAVEESARGQNQH